MSASRKIRCGRWRVVEGRRRTCLLPRGHEQECTPVGELRLARRHDELVQLIAEHECEQCREYNRAVADGAVPDTVVGLRCEIGQHWQHRLNYPGEYE